MQGVHKSVQLAIEARCSSACLSPPLDQLALKNKLDDIGKE